MNKKKCIYLVIAVYNEHETIKTFINTCDSILKDLKEKYDFIYLFSDDGSKDDTLNILREEASKKPYVKYLSFIHNFGQETGIYAGMKEAYDHGADAVIPMDVDLQDPPSLIPEFIKYWEQGNKVVVAHMRSRKGQAFIKKFLSSSFYVVYNLLTPIKGVRSGDRDFSIIDREVLKKVVEIKDNKRFIRGLVAYCYPKKRIKITYDYVERTQGTTKFSMKKMLRYSKNAILEFFSPATFISEFLAFNSFVLFLVFLIMGLVNASLWFQYIPIIVLSIATVLFGLSSLYFYKHSLRVHKSKKEIHYEIKETNLED